MSSRARARTKRTSAPQRHAGRSAPRGGKEVPQASQLGIPEPAWVAAALVVVVPLIFDPGGLQIFLPLKWACGLGLVGLGLAAAARRGCLPEVRQLRCWLPMLCVVLVAAAVGVAPLTGLIGGPGRNLGAVAWIGFAAAFALGLALARQPDGVRVVALALVIGSLAVSAYALVQALDLDPMRWDEAVDLSRARSSWGNAEHLAGYLVLVLPVCLAVGTEAGQSARWRRLGVAAALLTGAAILATSTRGAWAGALVALGLGAWRGRARLRPLLSLRWLLVAGAVLIAVGSITPIGARALSSFDLDRGTVRGRLEVYRESLELVEDRPVLGSGPDSFALVFPGVASSEVIRTIGEDRIADRAHNLVVDTLVQTGFAGLVALGWLVWSVGRNARQSWTGGSIGVGIVLGLVSYLVHLQFAFQLADLDLIVWLLAGCVAGRSNEGHRTAVRARPAARQESFRWLTAGAMALVGLAAFSWTMREAIADRQLRQALETEARNDPERALANARRASLAVPERVFYQAALAEAEQRIGYGLGDLDVLNRAAASARRAQRLQPNDLELALSAGEIALSRAEVMAAKSGGAEAEAFGEAEAAFQRAARLGPSSARAALRLGVAQVQQGKAAEAEASWQKAANIAPSAPSPWLNLGLLYVQQRRLGEARTALGTALRLDPTNEQADEALLRLPT